MMNAITKNILGSGSLTTRSVSSTFPLNLHFNICLVHKYIQLNVPEVFVKFYEYNKIGLWAAVPIVQ